VVLAGILSAIRETGKSMSEQTFMFLGAGEAGIGIGELLAAEIARQSGKTIEDARKHCLFLDSKVPPSMHEVHAFDVSHQ
jgi:malate dehydrogenase (oxaloacetate-decarboxylating)(NADP+)